MCDTVGIIEQGQLLATGTVDEIQQGVQEHRMVRMRFLEQTPPATEWLRQRDDVGDIQTDGQVVIFSHSGDRDSEAALLREMILADFVVAEFGSHSQSLEDVFLRVTEGRIQ